jgi:DNA-directed RNA polymerase subunit M/transcription elongation factor TFIIS
VIYIAKFCVDCGTVLEDNGFCPDCKKFMSATDSNKGIPEGKKTEKKEWKSCGYLSKSKNPKVLVVKIKNVRYIVNVAGLQKVISGKLEYTLIYEHIEDEEWQQLEKSRKAELMAIHKASMLFVSV